MRGARFKVGDFVKLRFVPSPPFPNGPDGELMWVKVTTCRGAICAGKLDNKPAFLRGIRAGDVVRFRPSQVLAVIAR